MDKIPKVYKIALTGGPCSGKSTAMSRIKQQFSDKYIVYILPEVATMTITSGVNIIPTNYEPNDHRELTKSICQMQIDLEKYYENVASLQKKDVIIMCDRGVCDNFAYCSKENKEQIMEETGWSQNYVCNERYNLVIHLVTAAIGAEKYYTLENNEARYESKEQARTLDGLTARSWIGHQSVQVIDNVGNDFNTKMERVLNSISSLVHEPQTQYQKKYLLKKPLNRDDIPSEYNVSQFTDTVTFLVSNNEKIKKRIIKRKFKKHFFPSYFLVQRVIGDKHSETRETQRILNERQYFDFLSQADQERIKLVKETMRFLLVKDSSYQICTVEHVKREGKDSVEILRVKRDTENKDDLIPGFLSIDKDISEHEEYFSRNMSKK